MTGAKSSRPFSRRRDVVVIIIGALLLAAAGLVAFWPHTIYGVVSDVNGPVSGATVRLRGSLTSTTTDAEGRFTLTFRGPALHRAVTAWKEGYYPAGADLTLRPPSLSGKGETKGIGLTLKPHPTADDPTYRWLTSNPDPNVPLGCGHCMAAYDEWKLDAHALSATNPRFLSIYNGTDLTGRLSVGPGWKLDAPNDPGNCANCHAPAAALAHNGSADMNRLSGVEAEGVLCDLCHKIGDVTLDDAGLPYQSVAGVQAYRLYRPAAGTQIFFGTLDDIPRRVSYSQLEKESRFCAGCHSGGWWGVSAYASYDEWLASPYAAEGVTCQACHMPPSGKTSTLTSPCAPAAGGGFADLLCRARACIDCHRKPADDPARNPLPAFTLIPDRPAETIHTHKMTGIGDEAFMRSSVAMTVTAKQGPDGVLAEVALTNVAAGHHIPTDSPMRNMILVVTARDAQGNSLPYLGTQVVPDWGGTDCGLLNADCGLTERGSGSPLRGTQAVRNPKSEIRNYAGLPGKGFAKVLEDWDGTAPAPQWRNGVRVISDTRIPARATDRSTYTFTPPADGKPASVEARLIYRRAFKPWMDAKGWNEPDLILAETTVKALPSATPVLADSPRPRPAPLFPPAQATTATGERLVSADVPGPEQCGGCHPAAAVGWQASGHEQAATAPLYRAWYKAADQDTQGQISPLCAGCHAPIGLLSGQIRSRWAWPGRELYPLDAQAKTGVSCAVCHAIVDTCVGNVAYVTGVAQCVGRAGLEGPYRDQTLRSECPNVGLDTAFSLLDQRLGRHLRNSCYIMAPDCVSIAEHESRSTQHTARCPQSPIPNPQFCAPCHEAANPTTGLAVMTTYSEWRASRFNTGDPATTVTCQNCHFADGRHGTLRAEDLQKAARIELLAPTKVVAGEELTLRVRVSNVAAGHDLPTGAAELRQMWLAVVVTDADGREAFSSGKTNEYGDPVEGSITYGTTWRDAAGHPTDRLWEAAGLLRDHRIPAGGSSVESYHFTVPAAARGPLHVRVALNYRPVSGYLSSLMTIYLGEPVPAAAVVEMGNAEAAVPVSAPSGGHGQEER